MVQAQITKPAVFDADLLQENRLTNLTPVLAESGELKGASARALAMGLGSTVLLTVALLETKKGIVMPEV